MRFNLIFLIRLKKYCRTASKSGLLLLGVFFQKITIFFNFSKSGLKSNEFLMRKQAEKYFSKFKRKQAGKKFRIKSKEFLIRKQAGKNNFSKKPKCQPQLKIGPAYRRSLCPQLVLCVILPPINSTKLD